MEQAEPSPQLLEVVPAADTSTAVVAVPAAAAAAPAVNPRLLGKFCEHLGANIYQGMEAQLLLNPTMARWRFSAGDDHPDGGVRDETDRTRLAARIAAHAARQAWPAAEAVTDSFFDGGAFGWFRLGARAQVTLGPAVGPHGGRAQRVETVAGAQAAGLAQWLYLPLHRVRQFEYRLVARAACRTTVTLRLEAVAAGSATGAAGALPAGGQPWRDAAAEVALDAAWGTFVGRLALPAASPTDALYRFGVVLQAPAHVVIDRVLLYPADHVDGADPEVIARLREARLPLLRWPGGNFASGYHWRDGVGPADARPSVPNPAWDGVEPNLFGTDEFLRFCRAVGCEPLICVNAGNGTAAEAAAWVEYCNGSTATPMGRLRAAHGHPRPYGVRYWEIGNELYGRWQVGWTTAAGNADRFRRFRRAMLAVDPGLHLIACGHGNEPLSPWNEHLAAQAGAELECISDHILTGGRVDARTDPVELFHAFMGYPTVLASRYRTLRQRLQAAGVRQPRLAITELQLFAHFHGEPAAAGGLCPERMPSPDTLAEALSLVLIVHTCIRLGEFVALLTHSATVNHGGGLRKARARVFANPVHHAHALLAPLAGGVPLPVRVCCGTYGTRSAFGHIPPLADVPRLDALAVRLPGGQLALSLVHRAADCGCLELTVELPEAAGAGPVALARLAAPQWWARNSLTAPEQVAPTYEQLAATGGTALHLRLPPHSYTRLIWPRP